MIPAERLAELRAIAEGVDESKWMENYKVRPEGIAFLRAFTAPTCLSLLDEIKKLREALEYYDGCYVWTTATMMVRDGKVGKDLLEFLGAPARAALKGES